MNKEKINKYAYWKANLRIVSVLLFIWFVCSFGAGIIFSDLLDKIKIGGFPTRFLVCSTRINNYLCNHNSYLLFSHE